MVEAPAVFCNDRISTMTLTFLDFIGLLGILLSCFLVVLIWSSDSFRSDVHHYFALTIISLNLCLAGTLFEDYAPFNGMLEIIQWPFLFPFAFLIYVLKAIKDPLFGRIKIRLLLLPCAILSTFQIIDFTTGFDVYDWLSKGDEHQYRLLIESVSFGFVPYAIAIFTFSYLKIRKAKNLYAGEKKWLTFHALSFLIFSVCWLLSDPVALLLDFAIWDYLLAALGVLLTVTTYRGVHQLNIFEQRRLLGGMQNHAPKNEQVSTTKQRPKKKTPANIEQLHQLMTNDRLYLYPALTRSMVADKLGLSDGYLSELIGSSLQSNFNDYINAFRVNRAMEMFDDEKFDAFSIEAIGYESGFKSKSVFYKAFKKCTNETPGAYRKRLSTS